MLFEILKKLKKKNKLNFKKIIKQKKKWYEKKQLKSIIVNNFYLQKITLINEFIKTQINSIEFQKKNKIKSKLFLYKNFIKTPVNHTNNNFITLICDLKKKQLYSSILEKNKLKKNLTNGVLLKEYGLIEKKKKKDVKLSTLNLDIMFSHLDSLVKKSDTNTIIINIKKTNNTILKLIKFIKTLVNKNFSKKNTIFIQSPMINFTQNKFKKIKAIKKKLRKKYIILD